MYGMFSSATSFNGDIHNWKVANVADMNRMFGFAESFNGDLSQWDVCNVQDMFGMFRGARSFNGDLSKWNVSNVKDMGQMFCEARSFKQKLCTPAWVHTQARKASMFKGTYGSISDTVCAPVDTSDESATTLATNVNQAQRQPPDRELIAHIVANTAQIFPTTDSPSMCSQCGKFPKSGRVSCCAPGGAWYKKCGESGGGNFDHSWSEGTNVCKRKFENVGILTHFLADFCAFAHSSDPFLSVLPMSTCSHNDGGHQPHMSQMRHNKESQHSKLLRARWFLVRKLWKCR